MKHVLLVGDSIRKGYDLYVRESMAELAEVFYPEENCRNSSYVLRDLHNWKEQLRIDTCDAVHFNVGHWDTLRIYGDEPLTRPEMYADNLERIVKRLRFLFPKAALIFATSTPVIESGYIKDFEMRYNSDVEKYNEIAVKTLAPLGVQINDLYALLKDKPELHSDQSHFYTADATELIGDRVASVLCDAMELDKKRLIHPDKEKFTITIYKNDNELYVKKGDFYELVQGI